ncbi:MAG: hypothetical protein IPL08_08330 [Saprospiraceae bacterium]|nr:hypothetical protein [Saprospiraceae bacterium]
MKILLFSLTLLILTNHNVFSQSLNEEYDKKLADSLGADDYGMKSYIFAILKTGPSSITDKEERSKLFKGHMENIKRLADEGKLHVAGPFGKNDLSYRGMFILNVKTIDEAKVLCDSDPAIKAGIFTVELIPWYGSAALGEYIKVSKKINKYKM